MARWQSKIHSTLESTVQNVFLIRTSKFSLRLHVLIFVQNFSQGWMFLLAFLKFNDLMSSTFTNSSIAIISKYVCVAAGFQLGSQLYLVPRQLQLCVQLPIFKFLIVFYFSLMFELFTYIDASIFFVFSLLPANSCLMRNA